MTQKTDDFSERALRAFQYLFLDIDEEVGGRSASTQLWFRLDGSNQLFAEDAAARWIMESVEAGFAEFRHHVERRSADQIVVNLSASNEAGWGAQSDSHETWEFTFLKRPQPGGDPGAAV